MLTFRIFWILVAFYVVVKVSFFIGVYIVTKSIERRALREKKKRLEAHRLFEIETLLEKQAASQRSAVKDREIFGIIRRRFVG